jgi:CRP/FNR family transcriptional regulator, anaerobic regulatory protein
MNAVEKLTPTCLNCFARQPCPLSALCGDSESHPQVPVGNVILRRGQPLSHQGDRAERLAVVRSGSLKCVYDSVDGREQIVAFALPGDVVDATMLGSGHHDISAVALETSSVCSVSIRSLRPDEAGLPILLRCAGGANPQRLDHTLVIAQRAARARLAWFIRDLAHRYGELGLSGSEFTLSMSRHDIANYLALAIETVSRLFTDLSRENILSIHGRVVEVLRPDLLAAIVEGERPAMPIAQNQ